MTFKESNVRYGFLGASFKSYKSNHYSMLDEMILYNAECTFYYAPRVIKYFYDSRYLVSVAGLIRFFYPKLIDSIYDQFASLYKYNFLDYNYKVSKSLNNLIENDNLTVVPNCTVVIEASSTKTAIHVFENYGFGNIKTIPKINIKGFKLDEIVRQGQYDDFYKKTLHHSDLSKYISASSCKQLDWYLLATGGMRNLEENEEGRAKSNIFYNLFREVFVNEASLYKNISSTLLEARTITGAEEGEYARLSFNQENSSYEVIDIGGETAQYITTGEVFTDYLGKERAFEFLQKENKILPCKANKYNGRACRENIDTYLVSFQLNTQKVSSPNKIYGISNLFFYSRDICDQFVPIIKLFLNNDKDSLSRLKQSCYPKKSNSSYFTFFVKDYEEYTEKICNFISLRHKDNNETLSKDICFGGNYIYKVLKFFGLNDDQIIYQSNGEWALGVAISHASNNAIGWLLPAFSIGHEEEQKNEAVEFQSIMADDNFSQYVLNPPYNIELCLNHSAIL